MSHTVFTFGKFPLVLIFFFKAGPECQSQLDLIQLLLWKEALIFSCTGHQRSYSKENLRIGQMNLLVQLLLSSNNFIAPIRMQKKKREREERRGTIWFQTWYFSSQPRFILQMNGSQRTPSQREDFVWGLSVPWIASLLVRHLFPL